MLQAKKIESASDLGRKPSERTFSKQVELRLVDVHLRRVILERSRLPSSDAPERYERDVWDNRWEVLLVDRATRDDGREAGRVEERRRGRGPRSDGLDAGRRRWAEARPRRVHLGVEGLAEVLKVADQGVLFGEGA